MINYFKLQIRKFFSLEGGGERVDINYNKPFNESCFDIYQKSHYYRYKFANNIISENSICGDLACGTGYGSIMLGKKAKKVIGVDINKKVIKKITNRYRKTNNVKFINNDLLRLKYKPIFDVIISFETIEHFHEDNILKLLKIFNNSLKSNGMLIFSTPYKQEKSQNAIKLGFHLTFDIDENKIKNWLNKTNFELQFFKYQDYKTHLVKDKIEKKDFIICVAKKK